jgi:competence protein ComEA
MFQFPQVSQIQKRAIYLLLALALATSAIFFSLAHTSAAGVVSNTPSAVPSFSPIPIPAQIPTLVVVDVAGKVLHPGVYKLPQGSRAIDAIKAAGKQLKGVSLTDINLAQVLVDGEQIVVGAPPVVSNAKSSKSKSGKSSGKITSGSISINSATVAQFEELPGVGAVMAARIVAYRTAHGPFATIDDLTKVSGMGKSKFANLKSFVRI